MLPNIGMSELLVILVLVLVIFGAGKLPEIGAGLSKTIRNFKKAVTGELDENEKSEEKELRKNNVS
jgi:sec-independent protein translocase protein TatA